MCRFYNLKSLCELTVRYTGKKKLKNVVENKISQRKNYMVLVFQFHKVTNWLRKKLTQREMAWPEIFKRLKLKWKNCIHYLAYK